MAESMCGPSNALQSFQKHTTVDRTLQQDRLVARQSPSHGFRSAPGPNVGLLEREFEAFQAGQLPLDNGFQLQHSFSPLHVKSAPQADPSNWASDFHRMSISSPQSQMSQNSFDPQIQQRQDAGWHQEFAKQNQGGVDQRMIQQPYKNYAPMSNMMGSQMGGFVGPQMGVSIAQQKQPEEAFNEEAFARAFEEAANAEASRQEVQVEATLQDTTQGVEMGQDVMINESAENLMASDELLDQARIGADSIYDPVSDETRKGQDDPNALARTAGHLLNSIRHEQSSKFKNSQFLELMRQFRDGQMVVDGDQVVEKTAEEPGPVSEMQQQAPAPMS